MVRRMEAWLDGGALEDPVFSIGGRETIRGPVPLPLGESFVLSIGVRPPDIELPGDLSCPPLLGKRLMVRVWLTRRRSFSLDIVGAPRDTTIITRALNPDGSVGHDCVTTSCEVSWNGHDRITGEPVAGAPQLPAGLTRVDDHTVRHPEPS